MMVSPQPHPTRHGSAPRSLSLISPLHQGSSWVLWAIGQALKPGLPPTSGSREKDLAFACMSGLVVGADCGWETLGAGDLGQIIT